MDYSKCHSNRYSHVFAVIVMIMLSGELPVNKTESEGVAAAQKPARPNFIKHTTAAARKF